MNISNLLDEEKDQIKEILFECDFAQIAKANDSCLVVIATAAYIPIENFKKVFMKTGELVELFGYSKLIFDKRALTVFHQPSMVWYFTEWKEKMSSKGLTCHRKILPRDPVFRECVKLGRENLSREKPDAKYHQMDIQYRNSIREAVES